MNILHVVKSKVKRLLLRSLSRVGLCQPSYCVTRPYVLNHAENSFSLSGKGAMVTGGSGALGRACCVALACEGSVVYVGGTNPDRVAAVVDEINNLRTACPAIGEARPLLINVTEPESIKASVKRITSESGSLHILVCSAGGSAREKASRLSELEEDVIENVLKVNLLGCIYCNKYAVRVMEQQQCGCIVNIASSIGIQGLAHFSEYSAAKAGIIAFTKSVAMESGASNVRVNCVSPGIVKRGIVNQNIIKHVSKTNYLRRLCTPEDIAQAVLFLCKEDTSSFITGHNLVVDGGRSLGLKEH